VTAAANNEVPRIEAAWTELVSLVESIGPEGLLVTGQDGWAVKDHLAHIAAWERSLLALVEKRDLAKAMGLRGPTGDMDAINHELWELHRNQAPDDALAYFRDTHAELMLALSRMSDADLQLPYNHYQPDDPRDAADDRPVIAWVAGDTYEHYAEHVAWMNQLIKESSATR
jgi:hypothetical protein